MGRVSPLERAVLFAIARQVEGGLFALDLQLGHTQVVTRENTGSGFRSRFSVASGPPMLAARSPFDDLWAPVDGLDHGMGFRLWLRSGRLHFLEGYTYGESTSAIDFERVGFGRVSQRP
jgi:hypothetical protein